MGCDLCGGEMPGYKKLEEAKLKARDYANKEKKKIILYQTETGFEYCTEERYFGARPGKFFALFVP